VRLSTVFFLVLMAGAFSACGPSEEKAEEATVYDLVLSDGRILDGCGNPWFGGDLAIFVTASVSVMSICAVLVYRSARARQTDY